MNKLYRVIFNRSTQTFQAVCEFARAQGKSSSAAVGSTEVNEAEADSQSGIAKAAVAISIAGAAMLGSAQAMAVNHVAADNYITISDYADGNNGQALSGSTLTTGYGSLAIGAGASATDGREYPGSVAIGLKANAQKGSTIAIGSTAVANSTGSIVVGNGSNVSNAADLGLIVGSRSTIVNTGDAAAPNANKYESQIFGSLSKVENTSSGSILGSHSTITKADYAIVIGAYSNAKEGADRSIVLGPAANAEGSRSMVFGYHSGSSKAAVNATAIGMESKVYAENATAFGTHSKAEGMNATAIGTTAAVSGTNATAIGTASTATEVNATTIGAGSKASAENATAIGAGTTVTGANTVALGDNINADTTGSVILGNSSTVATAVDRTTTPVTVNGIEYSGFAGKPSAAGQYVSFGSAAAPRQLKHVAAGEISAGSLDAINGSQLYNVMTKIPNFRAGANTVFDVDKQTNVTTINTHNTTVSLTPNSGLTLNQVDSDPRNGTNYSHNFTIGLDEASKTTLSNANQGWNITTSKKQGTNGDVSGTSNANVKLGPQDSTVTIEAADNINIHQDGRKITIGANVPKYKAGDNVTFTPGDDGVITISAAGGSTAAGGPTYEPGRAITFTKSDGKTFINAKVADVVAGNRTSITGDTTNGSFVINSDSYSVTGTGPVTVTAEAETPNEDGTKNHNFNVSVNTTSVTNNPNGSVSLTADQPGSSLVNGTTLVDAINKSGWTVAAEGGSNLINPGERVDFKAGSDYVTVAHAENGTGSNITYDLADKSKATLDKAEKGWTFKTSGNPNSPQNVQLDNADNPVKFEAEEKSGLNITHDGNTIKFKAETAPLAPVTSGDTLGRITEVPDDGKLATANQVANAINESGWKVTSGNVSSGTVGGTSVDLVKPSNTVKFIAGDNLHLEQNGKEFTYSLKKDLKDLTSVQAGPVTINANGIDAGSKPISNVSNGTNPNDAVNVSQLKANSTKVVAGNRVSVTNVSNTDGTTYTVNADSYEVTSANPAVTFTTKESENADGTKKHTFDLALNTTVAPTTEAAGNDAGKITATNPNNIVDGSTLADAINKSGWRLTTANTTGGTVEGNKEELINPSDLVTIEAGENIAIKQENGKISIAAKAPAVEKTALNVNDDGKVDNPDPTSTGEGNKLVNATNLANTINNVSWKLQKDGETKKAIKASDAVNFVDTDTAAVNVTVGGQISVDVKTTPLTTEKNPVTGNVTGKIQDPSELPDGKGNSLVNATQVAKAINEAGFWVEATGANLIDGNGAATLRKAGEKVEFQAGKNLKVKQNAGVITYETADVVSFANVTATDNIGIANGPKLTPTGIDAANKPITNVANGTNPNDAVNLSQLNATKVVVKDGENTKVRTETNATTGGTDYFVDAKIPAIETTDLTLSNTKVENGQPVSSSGNITKPTEEDGKKLVNATTVANAINNVSWTIAGKDITGKDAKNDVKAGNQVNFVNGVGTTAVVTPVDDGTTNVTFHSAVAYVNKDQNGEPTSDLSTPSNTAFLVGNFDKPLDPVSLKNVASGLRDIEGANTNATTFVEALGKIPAGDTGTLNNAVNVSDLKNAIGGVGFNLATKKVTGAANAESKEKDGLTKDGKRLVSDETFTLDAGNNIAIKQIDNGYEVATSENVTFNNVNATTLTVGDTTPAAEDQPAKPIVNFTAEEATPADNNELVKDQGGNPAVDEDGDVIVKQPTAALNITTNGSPTQLTGVGSVLNTQPIETNDGDTIGENGVVPGVPNREGDTLVDLSNLPDNIQNSAATVRDIANMGWVVSAGDNNYTATVKNADKVEFIGTGVATVTGSTDDETDVRTIAVNVDAQDVANEAQLPVVYTNKEGAKVYKQPDGTFNTKQDGSGTEVGAGDVIASMNNGNNVTAPTTLANVQGNLTPTYNVGDMNIVDGKPTEVPATKPTDAQKAPEPADVAKIYNNAATVGDVLNAGWNLQGNGDPVDFVKPYDTVNFVDGAGTLADVQPSADGKTNTVTFHVDAGEIGADAVDFGTEGNSDVRPTGKVAGPVESLNFSPEELELLAKDPSEVPAADKAKYDELTAQVAKAGNQVATAQNVADAINNAFWTVAGNNDPVNSVKPGSVVNFVNGVGTTATVTDAGDGITNVRFDSPLAYVNPPKTDGEGNPVADASTPSNTVSLVGAVDINNPENRAPVSLKNTASGLRDVTGANESPEAFVNALTKLDPTNDPAETLNNAVNVGDLKNVAEGVTAKGLNFAGNNVDDEDIHKDLGETLVIAGSADDVDNSTSLTLANGRSVSDKNTYVQNDGNTLIVRIAETPEFKGVTLTDKDSANAVNLTTEAAKPATNNQENNAPTTALNITSNDGKPTQLTGVGSVLNTAPVTVNAGDQYNDEGEFVPAEDKEAPLVSLTKPDGSPLDDKTLNSAATVRDIANMGWVVSASDNDYANTVKNADKVDFRGEDGVVVVGKDVKDENGKVVRTITVGVDAQDVVESAQLPVVYTNKDGDKLVKVGDKFYKADDLVDGELPEDQNGNITVEEVKPADIIASMNSGDNSSTTPTTLANVQGNLTPTYNVGDLNIVDGKPTKVAATEATKVQEAPKPADVAKIYNNAATVGDVLNAGWNLQGNGEAKDFVKPYDTVNFVDGKGTLAEVATNANGNASTVTFNVDAGDIALDAVDFGDENASDIRPTGKVVGPVESLSEEDQVALEKGKPADDASEEAKKAYDNALANYTKAGNQVATAQNVADAINNSFWTVAGNSEAVNSVKPGSVVNFVNGVGTTAVVTDEGDGVTNVRFDSPLAYVNTKPTEDGKVDYSTPSNTVVLVGEKTKEPAPVSLKNVASGLRDIEGANDSPEEFINALLDLDPANDPAGTLNNAVNVGDLKNVVGKATDAIETRGLNFAGNNVEAEDIHKDLGETLVIAGSADNVDNATSLKLKNGRSVSDKNTYVQNDGNTLVVRIAETPEFKGVDLTDADGNNSVGLKTEKAEPATNNQAGKAPTVALNITSNDGNPTQITGVGSVLNTADVPTNPGDTVDKDGNKVPGVTNPKGDKLVNLSNLPDNIQNSAATVRDIANMGWSVSASGNNYTNTVKNANKVDFKGEGAVTVTGTTTANGTRQITVGVDEAKIAKDTLGKLKFNNGTNTVVNDNTADGIRTVSFDVATTDLSVMAAGKVKKPAEGDKLVNATTVTNAINNSGWRVTGGKEGTGIVNGKTTELVQPGEEVTFKAGDNLVLNQKAQNFTYSLAKDININSVKANEVKAGPVTINQNGIDAGGKRITNVSRGVAPTDAVNKSQLDEVANAVGNVSWGIGGADGNKVADVKSGNQVNFVNGTGTTAVVTKGANGTTNVTFNIATGNVKFENGKATAAEPNKVATTGDVANVTNGAVANLTDKGLNFAGNNEADDLHKDLGETLLISGSADNLDNATSLTLGNGRVVSDKNTYVQNDGNALVVRIAERPEFTGMNLTNGTSTVNLDPVTDRDGTTALNLNQGGDPVRIKNVAPGIDGTDAVNVDQLKGVAGNLANSITGVANDANAGVSSAMAMAALPQAYIPGKSMLTGGVASYNGQGAIAVGLSRLSDNGRWVLKVSGSADSQGNAGGSVGAGFHF
ncbi:YadA-like family protein [Moraxella marmotae]|uniref:YadA-like family protein n=1 Tax=Moraxella marmotae TaxID=3344520 RepID=UPI0035F4161A